MTVTIPTKNFDGLPSGLVCPHRSGEGRLLGIFDWGIWKMARGRLAFKQRDLTRALRAVTAAGTPAQRVEIDREGKIVVFVGKPEQPDHAEDNEWD